MTIAVDKYRAAAEGGMSQVEAAQRLGVSKQAVSQTAARYGLRFRPVSTGDLSASRIAAIAELSGNGLHSHQIAAVTGLTPDTVLAKAKKAGFKIARKPKPCPKSQKVIELAAQGLTVTEVARTLGIHQSNVSWSKARYGIVFLKNGRNW